jgi:Zn-dependent M28 family amino/carboxypeptidase
MALTLVSFVAFANVLTAQTTDPPRVWPDEGPFSWPARATTPEIAPDDLRTHVYQLAADSMGGRAAGSRGNFMATEYVAAVFRRLGLEPAGVDGSYFQEVPEASGEYAARNVIAVLPGDDPTLRDEYVLVGAHNDHVGLVPDRPYDHDALRAFNRVMRPQGANDRPGTPTAEQQARIDSLIAHARSIRPPRPDSVMNGADDDASGTAVLLEIAERFATGPRPRRSIVFISHAAEEGGLLGSRWFTDNPTVPLESIVAAHNMDMLGNGGVTDVRFGGPAQVQMLGARRLSQEFGDVIDSLNAVRDETMAIDYSWDRTNALNRFCRSDQVSYFDRGIPVTYFSTGYSIDYHQATDEPQYLDYDHSARVGRFVHEIMSTVANRPTRLRVLPPAERDMSSRCG